MLISTKKRLESSKARPPPFFSGETRNLTRPMPLTECVSLAKSEISAKYEYLRKRFRSLSFSSEDPEVVFAHAEQTRVDANSPLRDG